MAEAYFVFCVHNHQPVGNFDFVIEDAYQHSYRPFLEALAAHPSVKFAIHVSGCLWEWIEGAHPEYIDLLGTAVQRGQVEILTGGFYEPILAMIPDDDKMAQISLYSEHLERRLGVRPRGLWLAERVWEPQLAGCLRRAGVEYTALDDFHFRASGLEQEELASDFFTEDQGQSVRVFPLSEALRYLIPFQPVEKARDHLREMAERRPGSLAVFGDDGEKFGVWPGTYDSVFTQGWLEAFLRMLEENADWLHTLTFSEWLQRSGRAEPIYLPTISYPEMMEWALPADRWGEYRENRAVLKERFGYPWSPPFLRGGYWRSFLAKYPESYRMYRKMLYVRSRLAEVEGGASDLESAWRDLWRGQCNCAYWHGVFGGLYLKHLRSEVYRRIINAEVILDRHVHGTAPWVDCRTTDFDGDGSPEVLLSSADLNVYVAPGAGGTLFEMDFKPARANLMATLARRREGYHADLVRASAGPNPESGSGTVSIHDRVRAKEEGLAAYLVYDRGSTDSWVDHFVSPSASAAGFRTLSVRELGDFVGSPYELVEAGDAAVVLRRVGVVETPSGARKVDLTKTLRLERPDRLELTHDLEAVDGGVAGVAFGSAFNWALASGDSPECFYLVDGRRPDSDLLGSEGEVEDARSLSLVDRILGVRVDIRMEPSARVLRFPLMTVSQSEDGFEKGYQSSVVVPLWPLDLAPGDRRSVRIEVTLSVPASAEAARDR